MSDHTITTRDPVIPELGIARRINGGRPILCREDVPYDADCIFNAGAAFYRGEYLMVFRNDHGFDGKDTFARCDLGVARSSDGIHFEVASKPFLSAADFHDPEITRVYDPRLTVIGDELYMCFAIDTRHGVCGGIARILDPFADTLAEKLEILNVTTPDNRNMVLFPEKIGSRYARLERPFPVYSRGRDRFDIWISYSPDMRYWGDSKLLLAVEDVPFANDKIGPGAPPVRTDRGWLALFHAVDRDDARGKNGWEERWTKRYYAGAMLLDPDDPAKVLGITKEPLLSPVTEYELDQGYRTHVVFPGGFLPCGDDPADALIYYGASDTFECAARVNIDELIAACRQQAGRVH